MIAFVNKMPFRREFTMSESNPRKNARDLSITIKGSLRAAQTDFISLYEQYFPLVFNVLRKASNRSEQRLSKEDITELTGHVFSRLWEELTRSDQTREFESDYALVAFLKRIAENHLTDQQRQRRKSVSLEALALAPPDVSAASENGHELDAAREMQRETLVTLTNLLQTLRKIGATIPAVIEDENRTAGRPGPKGDHLTSKMRRLFKTGDEVLEAIRKALRNES